MKLLLLAAGEGSRLKAKSEVKPLARLFGLTLLERAVKTAKKAGVSDIFVVVGYKADELSEFIKKKNLPVKIIYNENWKAGNGSSVLSAKRYFENENQFLIAMADHLSDGSIMKTLINFKTSSPLLLAVDKKPKEYIDFEDATKVLIDEKTGLIKKAGKDIESWNGIDTGFFLATPEIFGALEATSSEGSLTSALNFLASEGKAQAVDVSGSFWLDVDTPEAIKTAEMILSEGLLKKTDGPISKYINRRLSIPVSRILAKTSLTPNHISIISFFLGVISAFMFSLGKPAFAVLGGILTQISSVIDGCDGEVARLKLMESDFGGWFDAVLDRLADALILTGMSIYLLRNDFNPYIVLLLLAFSLTSSFLLSYTADKYDYFVRSGLVRGLRIGRDLRLFLVFLAGISTLIYEFLLFLSAVSFLEVLRRIYLAYRFSHEN
jgi:CDP-L-myo-inositol myo-inositolphosphotransferase